MNQESKTLAVRRARRVTATIQGDATETASERVARLYRSDGSVLVGWLVDEARRRGLAVQDMASEVGVTVGYISQLRTGRRPVENISREFVQGCAEFLGVAPVVVMIVAGCIQLSDFSPPKVCESVLLDRALLAALADPRLLAVLPEDLLSLSQDAKRALVSMYSALSGKDPMGFSQVPELVRWLQRAAEQHDDNMLRVGGTTGK